MVNRLLDKADKDIFGEYELVITKERGDILEDCVKKPGDHLQSFLEHLKRNELLHLYIYNNNIRCLKDYEIQ